METPKKVLPLTYKVITSMSKRISLKLSNENDWLIEAIDEERIEQNRPSKNNVIENILVSYFKERGIDGKSITRKKPIKKRP